MKKKHWNDYLWIATILYLVLGFVNILFAWLGMLCFIIPLIISIAHGTKSYCNSYCGRGQLLSLLANKGKLSRKAECPSILCKKWFRYGFLTFFLIMFGIMIFNTYLVFRGTNNLSQIVTLFWTIKLPWQWANRVNSIPSWIAQFAFGFYSLMLTSSLLGIITMFFWKPRTWCVYCPMGTMTQFICKLKNRKKL